MLVRHGESRATIEKFFGGARSCTGLTDNGRRQAEALRDRLMAGRDVQATALYSSKHSRAVETAQIITPALGSLSLKTDSGWGEHDPGPDIDGMPYDDFVALYGVPRWDGDPHDVVFPGGETVGQFQDRVIETLQRTVRKNEGGTVLVSCHGGVIDSVLRHTLHMHPVGKFELSTINTSLTELLHIQGSKWRLVRYNDAAHLIGLSQPSPREN
jgi:probable phosphoglycerate mutase